jgi:hypothetical protein
LISDQIPRGAWSDETTTITAEETAALAAYDALPERIIDGSREGGRLEPVKPKGPRKNRRGRWNKWESGVL